MVMVMDIVWLAACAWLLSLIPSQEKRGSQRYEKGVISFRSGQYPWTGNTHGGQYRWTHCTLWAGLTYVYTYL